MEVKMATTARFRFCHSSCSQTFASAVSLFDQRAKSPSSSSSPCSSSYSSSSSSPWKRRTTGDGARLICRGLGRSSLFGKPTRVSKSRSCDQPNGRSSPLRWTCNAAPQNFSEEEFMRQLQDLAFNFRLSDDDDAGGTTGDTRSRPGVADDRPDSVSQLFDAVVAKPWMGIRWPGGRLGEEIDEMSLSSQMIKGKGLGHYQGGVSESAYCSVKRAFSSMVFMIRELQSYTLRIRQLLFYEDLHDIVENVQKEIHASFVWLFQQVFSCTPTLMVYVMILLANFTVHSMGHNTAIAATARPAPAASVAVSASTLSEHQSPKFESGTFYKSAGKVLSIGGASGGGTGRAPPVAGGTDGGENRLERDLLFDSSSLTGNPTSSGSGIASGEDEWALWTSMVEEASKMQATSRGQALDRETARALVAPVIAEIKPDDLTAYIRTQLMYQNAIEQEPNNPLLLSNYAQFLYLVVHDHDRAEEYFQRAARAEPVDAEALVRYANFLWLVRKDFSLAEETFLEAIGADPTNTFYAGNYAHFLWNTGGEETCFPLDEA
ncbi:hypothetical protein EJ110_NYTH21966 [Nymphaea thermarum]|nr:hypothetical protein EJ110_NYTH21966 [Nymphaea thermarum]